MWDVRLITRISKFFATFCLLRLSILLNNFYSLTKFLDLYLAKFLDTSTKFVCVWKIDIYFLISLRLNQSLTLYCE